MDKDSFKNHMVIYWRLFVEQARQTFRKGTQGPNVFAFILSSVFRIWMDEKVIIQLSS